MAKQSLSEINDALSAMVERLSPRNRRTLLLRLATILKGQNQKRMAAETDPEGLPWTERKNPPRKGKNKKMMAGLRKVMKASATSTSAKVGFTGYAGKIARVHHYGLMAAVSKGGPRIRYEMRELIGIADEDKELLEAAILDYLSKG